MEKRVAILMSTYNGEHYLGEQIQSIIDQAYDNWHLYIRDDGSKDNTVHIIRSYADKDDRITFFNEKKIINVGVVKSFMELLEKTDADFYMFSDQDDFWLPDKVADTVRVMQSHPYQEEPIVVHTDLKVVDSNLSGSQSMNGDDVWHDFKHLMFSNCVTGCTMMVNQVLKKEMKFSQIDYHRIYMHDWWLAIYAAAFGEVVYLNKPTILYRQHGNNVVGSYEKQTLSAYIHRLFHQQRDLKFAKRILNMAVEMNRLYPDKLFADRKRYIQSYAQVTVKGTPMRNLALCLRLPPRRHSLKGDIFFSYLLIRYARQFRTM